MSSPATRVMLVEDERIVALNLKQRLGKLGYDVCALAASGEQALQEISRTRPDVVLMDVNIEGPIDGIETASRIPTDLQTPVIYLTAYSEQATLERARATTPYGYLLKPFSERELHATIQMVLARREADQIKRTNEQRLEKMVQERTAELTAANTALSHSQRMEAIGQLTGGIAHDFNNLLQGINGSLSMIKRRIAKGQTDNLSGLIEGALSSSSRAATLTQRLLAFSRRQPLSPVPVQFLTRVEGLRDLLARTLGEAIEIEISASQDLWPTKCDPTQLEAAILNLAINARDAMPSGGKLAIDIHNAHLSGLEATGGGDIPPGEYVCIVVKDGGVGMSREVLARAVDPFFTTKPLGQGTGLGLSMTYGFARQSAGTVKVQSELGKGTTVTICLPRFCGEVHPDQQTASLESKSIETAQTLSRVVLVVEDEEIVRKVILEVLSELGFQTIAANDGPGGLEVLRSDRHIDLMVTDIGLPGLNGRQLADGGRVLRPGLKILFMTGYADTVNTGDLIQPGMHLMTKPFDLDVLAKRVKEIVA